MKHHFIQFHDKNKHGEIIETETRPDMRELGLFSCSPGYDSREELIKGEGLLEKRCTKCGDWVKSNHLNFKEYEHLGICFSCNHWRYIHETRFSPTRFIIKGTSYSMYIDDPNSYFKGFGGRKFAIQRLGSDRVIETSNLWCQGDVPDIWKEELPDNAIFVDLQKPATYDMLNKILNN